MSQSRPKREKILWKSDLRWTDGWMDECTDKLITIGHIQSAQGPYL